MKKHGFNGEFSYRPEYSATEEDYEVAKKIFDGMGVEVTHISPIVDMQYEENRAILFSVARRVSNPVDDLKDAQLILFIEETGRRLYYVPDDPVPESRTEFEESLKNWTAIGEKVQKRSNLWDAVHRLSNEGEELAYHVVRGENPLIEILDEKDVGNGMVEWEVEYDERLENLVANHYDVGTEDVGEQMISDFIVVALQREIAKSNV